MTRETIRKRDRSITVRLSKLKARSIVDQMTILGVRSLSSDIEKELHRQGEYNSDDGWVVRKGANTRK